MLKAKSTASERGKKEEKKKTLDFKDNFRIYSQFKTGKCASPLDADFAASLDLTAAALAHRRLTVSKIASFHRLHQSL